MRTALLSTTLATLCLPLALQAPQDDPATRPTPTRGGKRAITEVVTEMQGAWRLESFDTPGLDRERRQQIGFLLVAGKYFSFELHVSWLTNAERIAQRTSQTGTYKFEIDERMELTAFQVIGSTIDDQGVVVWESPNRMRKYTVSCSGDKLDLTREDGTRFTFSRLVDSQTPRDIFGRPLKVKDPNAPREPKQQE